MTERDSTATAQSTTADSTRTCRLSEDVVIEGNLSSTGNLDFAGTITGDISANRLTLLPTARVKGNIRAQHLTIAGQFTGSATASALDIASTAHVEADLAYKTLSIEAGAQCQGKMHKAAGDT